MTRKGYILAFTGNGKGKTTAALGTAVRTLLAGKMVFFGQFIKGEQTAELSLGDYLPGFTIRQFGQGNFVMGKPSIEDVKSAREGMAISRAAIGSGEYDLVVTYHNYIPHLGTVNIEQADQYPDIESVDYDDSSGNGDGILNPGEIVNLYPSLTNFGSQSLSGIEVNCSLSHGFMNLNTTYLEYPDLAAGQTAQPINGLELAIRSAALGNMQGLLELNITDDSSNSYFDIVEVEERE